MNRIRHWLLVALVALVAAGCAHNPFNIPREDYEQRVKVLGVAPVFMDADSDIRHPERDALVTLVREYNRLNEKELVTMLREAGAYFMVRPIEAAAPDELFRTLLFRSERRDDAGVVYNKHFYKPEEIRTLVTQNSVDAVLLVAVSGLTMRDRIFASNLVRYLDSDYNVLTMTAQVLDANGTILWEYPNFRVGSPSTPVLAELQYPDFDQAAANMDERVEVKFKTIPGITRYLGQKEKDLLFRERKATAPYYNLFDDMVGLLKPPLDLFNRKDKKEAPPAAAAPPSVQAVRPVERPASQPAAAPVQVPPPQPASAPEPVVAVPEPAPIREVPLDGSGAR